MILRIASHTRNFTIIDNQLLQDPSISFRATGLLAFMLSQPAGWEPTGRDLAGIKSEGRDAIFAALHEIEAAGYLVRTTEHSPDGYWVHVATIYESLAEAEAAQADTCANDRTPSPGNPDPVLPDPVSQDVKAKNQTKGLEKKKKNTSSSPAEDSRTAVLGRELCELLAELMVGNGCTRPKIGQTWQTAAELMLRKDGRDPVEAADLLRWVQGDSFWKANVLSLPTFRAKYDQLRLARESRKAPSPWSKVDRTNRNPDNVASRDAPGRAHVPAHLKRNGAAMRAELESAAGVSP